MRPNRPLQVTSGHGRAPYSKCVLLPGYRSPDPLIPFTFQTLSGIEPYSNAKAEWGIITAVIQSKPPGDLNMLWTWMNEQTRNHSHIVTYTPLLSHLGECWRFQPERRPSALDCLQAVEPHRSANRSTNDFGGRTVRIW